MVPDEEIQVIHGPQPLGMGSVTYEVTLPSGMIVTNPEGFGVERAMDVLPAVVVAEDGRVLVPREPA